MYRGYRQNESDGGWTRIDLLLALYDNALERLDRAEGSFHAGESGAVVAQLVKTQNVLMALAAGVCVEVSPETNTNLLRLYEYMVTELTRPSLVAIANVRRIMSTLREGFEAVRVEANEMERTGQLASAERAQAVLVIA